METLDQLKNKIHLSEALAFAQRLPDNSINCVVTSPPYWGLRDYGTAQWEGGDPECDHQPRARDMNSLQSNREGTLRDKGFSVCPKCGAQRIDSQIGLEPTLKEFIERLVILFREIRRALRPDGVCWVNMGDSYAGGGRGGGSGKQLTNVGSLIGPSSIPDGIKAKDLCGQPWRLAFALQDDGWYLRSDVIWHKPNPMPESVNDRPTKSHEYVFLLTKSPDYWYDSDAIREPVKADSQVRMRREVGDNHKNTAPHVPGKNTNTMHKARANGDEYPMPANRNKRSVWTVPTEANAYAHFATFPTKLIEPMILAGCPEHVCAVCGLPHVREVERVIERVEVDTTTLKGEMRKSGQGYYRPNSKQTGGVMGNTLSIDLGFKPQCDCNGGTVPGVVYDPFMGSGTTARVARGLGRDYVGSELNPEYIAIAEDQLRMPFEPRKITFTDGLPGDKEVVGVGVQKSMFTLGEGE